MWSVSGRLARIRPFPALLSNKPTRTFVKLTIDPSWANLLAFPAVWAGRGLKKTLRLEGYASDPTVDPWAVSRGAIYCMWHENMLPATFLAPTHGLRVLVSQSRDGEFITRFIQGFHMDAIRGSSTRGAVR